MSHLFGPTLLLALCTALACTAPTPELVARERAEPGPPLPNPQARGRVAVIDGKLVTDLGTPLRGLTLPVDFDWRLEDFVLMTTIAQTTGLNTVHVYLENSAQDTGSNRETGDLLVSLTAQAGLYLVLSIGGGKAVGGKGGNGTFDPAKVTSFWDVYARRYAASTHVLFEIMNNPEVTCDKAIQPNTLTMERAAYRQIRGLAPDSHIILFSTSAVPRQAVVEQAIDDVSDVVDFSNASFAMHTDVTCVAAADIDTIVAAAGKKQVPVLISALPNEGWPAIVTSLEAVGTGWLHHRWLAYEPSLDNLFTEVRAAKLTWCPDRGDFPEIASGCR